MWVALVCAMLLFTPSCKSHKSRVKSTDDYELYNKGKRGDKHKKDKEEKPGKADKKTDVRDEIVSVARSWIGTPYSYGGETRSGVDCSGLVMNVYLTASNIKLPRSSAQQHAYCRNTNEWELLPGDLVFFAIGKKKGSVNHVGVYVGNGCFVHASSSRGVIMSDLDQDYYRRNFVGGGRVPALAERDGNNDKTAPQPQTAKPFEVVDSVGIDSESIREALRRASQR